MARITKIQKGFYKGLYRRGKVVSESKSLLKLNPQERKFRKPISMKKTTTQVRKVKEGTFKRVYDIKVGKPITRVSVPKIKFPKITFPKMR